MTPAQVQIARHRLGMSLAEFASLLGTNPRTVARWITPGAASPKPATSAKIEALIGTHWQEVVRHVEKAEEEWDSAPGTPVRLTCFLDPAAIAHLPGLPVPTMNAQIALLVAVVTELEFLGISYEVVDV